MKFKSNTKRYSVFALAAVFFAALFAAVGLLISEFSANADRSITLTGSNYFYTSNEAEVEEYCTDSSASTYYTGFVFNSDDDYVTYRKNLAYKWYNGKDDAGYFSLTVGFSELSFETFTIKFQSQQYTLTEDAVTTNYLTFVAGTDCVYILTTTEEPEDSDIEEAKNGKSYAYSYSSITIAFTGYEYGVYTISITDGTTTSNDGTDTSNETYKYTLENVGSTYSKYVSSSSSNSVIPLTFSAAFAESATETKAEMILYSLNGQSFELTGSEGSMTVTDNVAPVLCLDDDFTTVRYGYGLEVNYAVIDVLATSPRTTINYYVLNNGQAEDTTLDLDSTTDNEYIEVSTSDTYAFIDSKTNISYVENNDEENDRLNRAYTDFTDTTSYGYTTKCLVKIYFTIQDSTASGGTSDNVYLDWYVEDTSLLAEVNGYSLIRAVRDIEGVSYTYTPIYSDNNTNVTCTEDSFAYTDIDTLMAEYQYAVEQAVIDQEATAGDGNYLYLPSFEKYVTDNLTGYRDLTYSVYYVAGSDTSVSSNTSLDSNELAIELSTDGTYRFVIYATDGESNEMYYWSYEEKTSTDAGGNVATWYEWEKVTFTASDLSDMLSDADSELWNYIPYFEFKVTYEGLVVEDPEAQDIAYVYSSYTASSFDITGLNSGYETSYTLYVFDREAYTKDTGSTISYSYILNNIETLFKEYSGYFTLITALDDLEETDDYYDDYCDYEWEPDSLTFVPQDENTFYVIRLEVKDTTYLTADTVKYMVISSSAAAEELTGESKWLQDNLASIILLAVAGAALIGIILLIVIKPKEKGDIDVIDLNEEDKKSRKKIAKGKSDDTEAENVSAEVKPARKKIAKKSDKTDDE